MEWSCRHMRCAQKSYGRTTCSSTAILIHGSATDPESLRVNETLRWSDKPVKEVGRGLKPLQKHKLSPAIPLNQGHADPIKIRQHSSLFLEPRFPASSVRNHQSSPKADKTGLKINTVRISMLKVSPLLALCMESTSPKRKKLKVLSRERLDIQSNYRFNGTGVVKDIICGRAYNKITINKNHWTSRTSKLRYWTCQTKPPFCCCYYLWFQYPKSKSTSEEWPLSSLVSHWLKHLKRPFEERQFPEI